MGQKVNPVGLRVGIIRTWDARWFSQKEYRQLLEEDIAIRQLITKMMVDAGISRITIDRSANNVFVTVHSARPGIIIGRSGARIEELRQQLEKMTRKRVRVNIHEIRHPETEALLVARSVAEQIQRRVAYKRAMKQAVQRAMQRGAKGIKIVIGGRLGGAEMSRREREVDGKVPLHTLRADIDYAQTESQTTYGTIGVKVWIYHGEVLPVRRTEPAEAATTAELGAGEG